MRSDGPSQQLVEHIAKLNNYHWCRDQWHAVKRDDGLWHADRRPIGMTR